MNAFLDRVAAFNETAAGYEQQIAGLLVQHIATALHEQRIAAVKDLDDHNRQWQDAKHWLAKQTRLRRRTINRMLQGHPMPLRHYAAALAVLRLSIRITIEAE